MEQWKWITGYEGLYQVSTHGRIKSFYQRRCPKNIILKQSTANKYYKVVGLRKNKKLKTCQVHRLVGKAFIPNPENKPEINHIDNNPGNNHVGNLEWCTRLENIRHGIKMGSLSYTGDNAIATKLNEFQVRVIRKCDELTYNELRKVFNVAKTTIGRVKRNETWTYLI